jgi:hypothetical protein
VRQLLTIGGAVCVCALAGRAEAQRRPDRFWIDADVAVAVAAGDVTMQAEVARPVEPATFVARYELPRSAAFDVGGGVMLTPRWGLGVSAGGTVHEHSAELTANIPHPFFPGTYATDTDETERLMQRIERSLSLQAVAVVARPGPWRVRVFGGPTFFRIEQDVVREIFYNHFYFVRQPTNGVELTGVDLTRVSGTGWGFHGGADASVFVTRFLGVGAFARVSRGTVDMENTLATGLDQRERVAVKAGGVDVGAGIRLRF